ncbi:MAG: protein-glutamate O-methyltransferase CheR [bacterium]|nr:protein-glutamate O-methyltransferase CheR [bacterium]
MGRVAPITEHEFNKIRDLLVSVCGIDLKPDQDYLVETRLSELAVQLGATTFGELHRHIIADPEVMPKVVDLMTTNETLWFRDASCWLTLKDKLLPHFFEQLKEGKPKIRVWSAASSTGQEAYSLAILIDEECRRLGHPEWVERFEIRGTDISTAAVFLARQARYDSFTVSRGLSAERCAAYFHKEENSYQLHQRIIDRARFEHFNLMESFAPLGRFDLVFCRNVAIYFSKSFKEELFEKIAGVLNSDGFLLLGATESLFGLKAPFTSQSHLNGVYYVHK